VVTNDGRGSESIFDGALFGDENFLLKHSQGYLVSMKNTGADSNGSQFHITFEATPWLDNKSVVFGQVVEGQHVVRAIRDVGSSSGNPLRNVVIVKSGELPL